MLHNMPFATQPEHIATAITIPSSNNSPSIDQKLEANSLQEQAEEAPPQQAQQAAPQAKTAQLSHVFQSQTAVTQFSLTGSQPVSSP